MDSVTVKVLLEERVSVPAAQQLLEDWAEWIEEQGLMITRNPQAVTGNPKDDRSYEELARDFLVEYG